MRSGHLALASCTRFSPNTRWPAAITGSIDSGPKVLEIATRVTEAGSRRASAQADAISRRTAAGRSAAPTGAVARSANVDSAFESRRVKLARIAVAWEAQWKDAAMTPARIYLAGPDVFLPDAAAVLAAKRKLCADYGFVGVAPVD